MGGPLGGHAKFMRSHAGEWLRKRQESALTARPPQPDTQRQPHRVLLPKWCPRCSDRAGGREIRPCRDPGAHASSFPWIGLR